MEMPKEAKSKRTSTACWKREKGGDQKRRSMQDEREKSAGPFQKLYEENFNGVQATFKDSQELKKVTKNYEDARSLGDYNMLEAPRWGICTTNQLLYFMENYGRVKLCLFEDAAEEQARAEREHAVSRLKPRTSEANRQQDSIARGGNDGTRKR